MAAALAACGGGGGADSSQTVADAVPASLVPTGVVPADAGTVSPPGKLVGSGRAWHMGFGGLPPRPDLATVIANIETWSPRADMAAIHDELPWTELLSGVDAEALIQRDQVDLVKFYRSKGLKLLFVTDLNDGLARESEAPQLRALGRSLTEPAVQQAWRRYVMAAARLLQPDWMCLAAETNLVRIAAPAALYMAVRQCANDGATDLRAGGLARLPVLMSSVQVETAWGLMPGQDGQFAGIATDRTDFSFTECLGLSSYPYLAKARPEELPDNWYSRVVAGSAVPTMVVEGGWSSASVASTYVAELASSPDLQRRFIERHALLLDSIHAVGWVQLYFADLDLSALRQPLPDALNLFAHLGLTDSDFNPKSALQAWDALHARKLD